MRVAASFRSEGQTCAGFLYLPRGASTVRACVVLANGFSGTMDWILPDFARRFVQAGFAALIFDYRHLGASEGEPRQLIDLRRQRADLASAVAFVRHHPALIGARVALWGTSLGASHVVELAARDRTIAAVICNAPALDAVRGANVAEKARRAGVSKRELARSTARLAVAALRDALQGALGLAPHYVQVYGTPGHAIFTDPRLRARFAAVAAGAPTWRNQVAARFLLRVPRYVEGTLARVEAPILFSLARDDAEVSPRFIEEKARQAPRAEIYEYPVEHFDLYHGETFERVVADQLDFLRRALG